MTSNNLLRKSSFVLLELLIAFALVSSAILPFIRYPYKHMKQEIDALFYEELERRASNRLAQLQIEILSGIVPDECLFGTESKSPRLGNAKLKIKFPHKMKRTYDEKTSISWKKQKIDEKRLFSLITLKAKYYAPGTQKKPIVKAETKTLVQKEI